ncbi:MAG: XTP/dITP diphosphatase [Candidatus Binatia bacterium]
MGPLLLIATTNVGKFREFCELLRDLPVVLRSLSEFPGAPPVREDGETYRANAIHKALTLARWSRCATLADDSGLEVDALGGAPGLRSARYAGSPQDAQANIEKLLAALAGIPPAERTARFRCVIAVACPDGATLTAEGSCEGRILDQRCGGDGFGYDPIFFYPPAGMTFAAMPAAAKNRVSHRARACAALRKELLGFLSAHA